MPVRPGDFGLEAAAGDPVVQAVGEGQVPRRRPPPGRKGGPQFRKGASRSSPATGIASRLISVVPVEHNSLAPREFMLARMAALIAVDAPSASYLVNAEATEDSGVTADDIQGVVIAVAPVVARVVSAGGKILRALGLAIAVADSERPAMATPGSRSLFAIWGAGC